MESKKRISSPVSTGGGGTFFEQHVNALFLGLLLVRAPLPVLKDSQVEEVLFQTEHLGWKTDDILVVAKRPDSVCRRLVIQIKRPFTISESNEECKKAFVDFWDDFVGPEFDREKDRFALVTLRGTNTLLDGFNSLLDCARASADSVDFMHRLSLEGFLSKTAHRQVAIIRKILEDPNGTTPTDETFWQFLSVLHVLSFDLNTSTAQTETLIKSLLAFSAKESNDMMAADSSWSELLKIVGAGMPVAARYRYIDLPEDLRKRHGPIDTRSAQVVRKLSEHSEITLNRIKTTIGPKTKIVRDTLTSQIIEALREHQIVVVTAPAGFGKSAVAKDCVQFLSDDQYCLTFGAEEFATAHIDDTLNRAQILVNGKELLGIFSGQGQKLLFVDSIERLLEHSVRDAFTDLLNLAKEDRSLGLLLTCREYSLETVQSAIFGRVGIDIKVIEVPFLTDQELDQVASDLPTIKNALNKRGLKNLLRSPYMLDRASQMDWSVTDEATPTTELEFLRRCWGEVIRHDSSAVNGMPQRREQVFGEVALRRARQLCPFVSVDDLDAGALEALQHDGLVNFSPEASSMAAPAHDVLEDWSIIHWIGNQFVKHDNSPERLSEDIGKFPAIRRAYRKWLLGMIREDPEMFSNFVISVIRDRSLPAFFIDDTLVSALLSPSVHDFLERQRKSLFEDNGNLLIRAIHLLRVACKSPPWWLRDATRETSQFLVASGEAWSAIIRLAHDGIDQLLPRHIPILLGLIEDFTKSIDWLDPEPKGFEEAAKIGFRLLEHLRGFHMYDTRERALKVIAKVPRGDASAFANLIEQAIEESHE